MTIIDLLENEILSCMKCKYIIRKKSIISFLKSSLIDTLKTGTQKGILKKQIPDAKQDKNPLTVNQ